MSLPERLYYPLDKAAKEIGCDISDIIHWAANGIINVCVRVYSPPPNFRCENTDWISSFLVNERNLKKYIKTYCNFSSLTFEEKSEGEDKLATVAVEYDFYNSYFRVHGRIDCYISESDGEVCDYSDALFGVYGLIELGTRDIFINEFSICKGDSIEVGSFSLPMDLVHKKPRGFFEPCSESFETDSLNLIDKDSPELKRHQVENYIERTESKLLISLSDMVITEDEMEKIKKYSPEISISEDNVIQTELNSPKTISKISEILTPLIKMIDSCGDLDLENMSISKLKNILEATAAQKGVALPDMHSQTWSKYLGRERKGR